MADKDLVRFYRDSAGEWRWVRLDGGNYKKVADSAEGYRNREDCIDQAMDMFGDGVEYKVQGDDD